MLQFIGVGMGFGMMGLEARDRYGVQNQAGSTRHVREHVSPCCLSTRGVVVSVQFRRRLGRASGYLQKRQMAV